VINIPRLDGTGPNGQGAMTGRRLGNCKFNDNECQRCLRRKRRAQNSPVK